MTQRSMRKKRAGAEHRQSKLLQRLRRGRKDGQRSSITRERCFTTAANGTGVWTDCTTSKTALRYSEQICQSEIPRWRRALSSTRQVSRMRVL